MGLANKSVVPYQSIKIGQKWTLRPVDEDSSHFSDGPFLRVGTRGDTVWPNAQAEAIDRWRLESKKENLRCGPS